MKTPEELERMADDALKDINTHAMLTSGEDEEHIFLCGYCAGYREKVGSLGWQLCPKCLGQGNVERPHGLPSTVTQWTSSQINFQCDVCLGKKIISLETGNPKS
jgi:hypothetical protein